MASVAPLLATQLVSMGIAKIGKSQGWNPTLTGLLSAGAGMGVGAGLSPGGFSSIFSKPVTEVATKITPGVVGAASARAGAPLAAGIAGNPHSGFAVGDIMKVGQTSYSTVTGSSEWEQFMKAMGGQVIDSIMAEEPPVQHQATGGGGGGSSPLGSPYQGGNGVSGQYKLTSGMPGRAQGIQWKGI